MTAFSLHARRMALLLLAATLSQLAMSAPTQGAVCEDDASTSCASRSHGLLQTGPHGRQAALSMLAAADPLVTASDGAAAEATAAEKAAASVAPAAEAKAAEEAVQADQTNSCFLLSCLFSCLFCMLFVCFFVVVVD
ncbi:unnamed protein product [Polarella glacialis]|uniref:Uncharacterized protein n=1 Tax=Polarella glacialis TaxID=89957 RepID=A0A813FAN8_POLGL|nr:unnamed protein product [Polarella glacialis]